jgi:NAD(P)-dependent dehydrogenase (short-subunit alcohol dehydrogenase family)
MSNVVVTGTSTGIGQATAASLAHAGHVVFATMRNPEASGPLRELAGKHASNLHVRALDVDSDESVEACFEAILAEGRVDALVNNAGLGGGGAIEETPIAAFRRCIETNYLGTLRCTKAVLPAMREQRSGCIVNVSSIAGRMGLASQGPYAASKFAIEGLSEILAQELAGTGVRVAVVEPGVIATPIFEKVTPSPPATNYPHRARLLAFFKASLAEPVSPSVVGDLIRDIIESDRRELRYPAGPDAEPLLAWRKSKTGREWAEIGALDNEGWAAEVHAALGLDVKPYLSSS